MHGSKVEKSPEVRKVRKVGKMKEVRESGKSEMRCGKTLVIWKYLD